MINEKKMRTTVLVIYEPTGYLDEYVLFLMAKMRECSQYLVVIVNGNIEVSSENKISEVSDKYIKRDNKGYDIGAYRDAVLNYIPRNLT